MSFLTGFEQAKEFYNDNQFYFWILAVFVPFCLWLYDRWRKATPIPIYIDGLYNQLNEVSESFDDESRAQIFGKEQKSNSYIMHLLRAMHSSDTRMQQMASRVIAKKLATLTTDGQALLVFLIAQTQEYSISNTSSPAATYDNVFATDILQQVIRNQETLLEESGLALADFQGIRDLTLQDKMIIYNMLSTKFRVSMRRVSGLNEIHFEGISPESVVEVSPKSPTDAKALSEFLQHGNSENRLIIDATISSEIHKYFDIPDEGSVEFSRPLNKARRNFSLEVEWCGNCVSTPLAGKAITYGNESFTLELISPNERFYIQLRVPYSNAGQKVEFNYKLNLEKKQIFRDDEILFSTLFYASNETSKINLRLEHEGEQQTIFTAIGHMIDSEIARGLRFLQNVSTLARHYQDASICYPVKYDIGTFDILEDLCPYLRSEKVSVKALTTDVTFDNTLPSVARDAALESRSTDQLTLVFKPDPVNILGIDFEVPLLEMLLKDAEIQLSDLEQAKLVKEEYPVFGKIVLVEPMVLHKKLADRQAAMVN